MEQQFILRLPDSLKDFNPKECKMVKVNQREVNFITGGRTYPGIICRIPTIVESQKIVDNKLYKIADISTLVVIYEEKSFDVDEEIWKHESSGLTPPMAHVRERRFSKTSVKTEEVEKIERKVADMLKADSKAIKVDVMMNDSMDAEIDVLAAEIENELSKGIDSILSTEENVEITVKDKIEQNKDPEIQAIEEKIREKEEQISKAVNPILKKRFEQALEALKAEYEKKLNGE